MPNFMYKGTDINEMITKGASNVPTAYYKGFPAFTTTTTDYGKIKNDLLYQISKTDIVSDNSIQAASYKTVDSNSPCPIPAWCNGVKFYISSAKGSSGSAGNKGEPGAQGPQGPQGPNDVVNGCPASPNANAKRPKSGGPGGPGGPGGDGGPGGAAGVGGEGVYFYNTSLIPVTAGSSVIIDTTTNMSLTISGSTYTANKGGSGNDGSKGKPGDTGGPGNAGSPAGNKCQSDRTAAAGKSGSKGATGGPGADGTKGVNGYVSSLTTVTQGTNTTDSKEITIYFFATT